MPNAFTKTRPTIGTRGGTGISLGNRGAASPLATTAPPQSGTGGSAAHANTSSHKPLPALPSGVVPPAGSTTSPHKPLPTLPSGTASPARSTTPPAGAAPVPSAAPPTGAAPVLGATPARSATPAARRAPAQVKINPAISQKRSNAQNDIPPPTTPPPDSTRSPSSSTRSPSSRPQPQPGDANYIPPPPPPKSAAQLATEQNERDMEATRRKLVEDTKAAVATRNKEMREREEKEAAKKEEAKQEAIAKVESLVTRANSAKDSTATAVTTATTAVTDGNKAATETAAKTEETLKAATADYSVMKGNEEAAMIGRDAAQGAADTAQQQEDSVGTAIELAKLLAGTAADVSKGHPDARTQADEAAQKITETCQVMLQNAIKISPCKKETFKARDKAAADYKRASAALAARTARSAGLNRDDQYRLKKLKGGFVNATVKQINPGAAAFQLAATDREKPWPEGTGKKDKAKGVGGTANDIFDTITDVSTPLADAVGSGQGINLEMGFLDVGHRADLWENPGEATNGASAGAAGAKCAKSLIDIGKQIYKIVKFVKESKAGGHTSMEKWDFAKGVIDTILGTLDSILSGMSVYKSFLGVLPIVGAVLGAVTAGFSAAGNIFHLIEAVRGKRRMKEQRSGAKEAVRAKMTDSSTVAGSKFVENKDVTHRLKKTENKFKIKQEFDDEKVKYDYKKTFSRKTVTKERNARLDEKLAAWRKNNPTPAAGTAATPAAGTAATPAAGTAAASAGNRAAYAARYTTEAGLNQDTVRDMEDYDVAKEITRTSKRRIVDLSLDLGFKDILGFATALAGLDPTGVGATVGASISAAVGIGFAAKTVGHMALNRAREHGHGSANNNKSETQRNLRWHNLSVITYDRLLELKGVDIDGVPETEPTVGSDEDKVKETEDRLKTMDQYQAMEDRLSALGVAAAVYRAANGAMGAGTAGAGARAKAIVSAIRGGFSS